MTAIAMAGVVGNPASGWILEHFHRLGGLAGWQWLFMLEGIPSVLGGIGCLLWLTDRPEQARWLGAAEREWLARRMDREGLRYVRQENCFPWVGNRSQSRQARKETPQFFFAASVHQAKPG